MSYTVHFKNNIKYLTFPILEPYSELFQCFTTRVGGVSEGCYASLNLGFGTDDKFDNVFKNYEILSKAVNIDINNFVTTAQTHTNNIRIVTNKDKGKGVTKKRDYENIDGLITNESNIALVTTHADCTPLFFYNPKLKIIGVAHAGWKGTLYKIAENMIDVFVHNYNSKPEDIIVGIGPSLSQYCFEVDIDVAELFINVDEKYKDFMYGKGSKKYIDLWAINEYLLVKSGVKKTNIENMKLCTKCNMDLFYSHRGQHGERGIMASVMQLNY
ncbi:peptidoglycan editing factor PgeF [Sedimentibacter sp. zth1]|uniref:peptidoglycan editing factor PgeF n=1 Tax=Sedimentibacter sp. zth1 TaxID=2816908 RepID=UPI001A92B3DB|nr:peptidoglycan editing factor PgeF [Sedimentibacter sp. zth1]QSX04769.1 peptidoglycan editing factor PgeF [Sedimentibacter sp. zth1]